MHARATGRLNVRHAFVAACLLLVAGSQAAAQRTAADPLLDRIEALIAADRLDDARAALREWDDANTVAPGADRAQAGLLRARLARTWSEAEEALIATAVGYPVTQQAPIALLRLGQGLVTAAETGNAADAARRAVAWLERLVNDYPTAPARAEGFLWLARALHADGRGALACRRLEQAPIAVADSITASLIESARRLRCNEPLVRPARRP